MVTLASETRWLPTRMPCAVSLFVHRTNSFASSARVGAAGDAGANDTLLLLTAGGDAKR